MNAKSPFTQSARTKEDKEKASLFFMFLLYGLFRDQEKMSSENGFKKLLEDSARQAGITTSSLTSAETARIESARRFSSAHTAAPADNTATASFSRAAAMGSTSAVGLRTANGLSRDLLDVIAKPESGGDYNIAFRGRRPTSADGRDLEHMTIKEVLAWQSHIGGPSTAVGRYQILKGTLEGLVKDMHLSGNEVFDRGMQDRLALKLMERRGLNSFLEGRIDIDRMMRNLSQEWAGLPKDHSGRSYYHGDGLNRAGIAPSVVADSLSRARDLYQQTGDTVAAVGAEPATKLGQYNFFPGMNRT